MKLKQKKLKIKGISKCIYFSVKFKGLVDGILKAPYVTKNGLSTHYLDIVESFLNLYVSDELDEAYKKCFLIIRDYEKNKSTLNLLELKKTNLNANNEFNAIDSHDISVLEQNITSIKSKILEAPLHVEELIKSTELKIDSAKYLTKIHTSHYFNGVAIFSKNNIFRSITYSVDTNLNKFKNYKIIEGADNSEE